MSTPSQTPATTDREAWLRGAALCGPAGRRWLRQYRRAEVARLEKQSEEALLALRRGQLDEGKKLLVELAGGISRLDGVASSIRLVLLRWYHGVLAYHDYAAGDYDAADANLQAATDAVREAISEAPFLMLLANHCQEFRLHQARIARGRRRWQEMRAHVENARRMHEDELPLCELRDGKKIFLADLQRFCEALPASARAPDLHGLFDDRLRRRQFESFVHSLYVLPGFVLPYS